MRDAICYILGKRVAWKKLAGQHLNIGYPIDLDIKP
jgi:hypothetical protein